MQFFLRAFVIVCVIHSSIFANSFTLIPPNSPFISKGFSQLGEAYRHKNLIWSNKGPSLLNYEEAKQYCSLIQARLPTIKEWKLLYGADIHNIVYFNAIFWSSTEKENAYGSLAVKTFHDYAKPYATRSDSKILNAVRCVVDLSEEDIKAQIKEADEEIERLKEEILNLDELLLIENETISQLIQINSALKREIKQLKNEMQLRKSAGKTSDNFSILDYQSAYDELGYYGWY